MLVTASTCNQVVTNKLSFKSKVVTKLWLGCHNLLLHACIQVITNKHLLVTTKYSACYSSIPKLLQGCGKVVTTSFHNLVASFWRGCNKLGFLYGSYRNTHPKIETSCDCAIIYLTLRHSTLRGMPDITLPVLKCKTCFYFCTYVPEYNIH